jgi:serine/threonine-protein kinase
MIGHTLSHYEVLEKLGSGGMGIVYLARDTKLDRDVAIKVLPEAFSQDKERLVRFEREAKLLASLNHPNIAAIHELAESDGIHFLALEYVPGETLAERVKRGPIPVDDALPLFKQIAEGIEGAHEKGVIHRDLKPANIKITPEGNVKILDFGLAKALAGDIPAQEQSESPTLTRDATEAGVLLGTAPYMSPEQARGKAVDKRTDIWAFGCCFFEALTGGAAFLGETVSDTLAAVLRAEIPWAHLPEATQMPVRRLLRRCLERDVTQRLQHIGDARLELEDALDNTDPTDGHFERQGTFPWPMLLVAAALLTLLIVSITYWATMRTTPVSTLEPRRSLIQTEPLVTVHPPTLSPDGRRGIYSTGDRLWIWELDRFEPRSWDGEFRRPFFSPDSQHVAFEHQDTLWRMDLETRERRLICPMPSSWLLHGGVWSANGTITFATWGPNALFTVPEEGGEVVQIGGPFDVRRDLTGTLPDNKGLLFVNAD